MRILSAAAFAIGYLAQATSHGSVGSGIQPVLYGYDVVEYFSLDASASGVKGSEEFQANVTRSDLSNSTQKMEDTVYTFFFNDAENRDKFKQSPNAFAPQWGGF